MKRNLGGNTHDLLILLFIPTFQCDGNHHDVARVFDVTALCEVGETLSSLPTDEISTPKCLLYSSILIQKSTAGMWKM
jgi:hypothetical protein